MLRGSSGGAVGGSSSSSSSSSRRARLLPASPAMPAAGLRLRAGPPSLTLGLGRACVPVGRRRRRPTTATTTMQPPAAAASSVLPFPADGNANGNGTASFQQQHQQHQQHQQQQALPFLETVWRTIAAGGAAPGSSAPDGVSPPPLYLEQQQQQQQQQQRVTPLPPPPRDASFVATMPYLARLALSERQMWWRVAAAFCCMVASKAAGLSCPLFLKRAVDALSAASLASAAVPPDLPAAAAAAAAASTAASLTPAVHAVLCFGACSMLQHLAKELQHPAFTPVSQAVARRVAYHCFAHVLDLDIRYHLERRTGRLSRILERGTRSVQVLYRAVLFTFAPTAVELCLVLALLAGAFSPLLAGLVGLTFLAYVAWTLAITHLSVEVRKRVNSLDNLATSKAVDALLNAETVALFDNAALEVAQYDAYLVGYQRAAVQTERLSALLNAGQSVVLAAGLTSVLLAAVLTSGNGGGAAASAAASAAAAAAADAAAGSGGGGGWLGGLSSAFQSFMAWAVATPEGAARFGVGAGAAGGGGVSGGDLVLLQGLLLQLWAPLQFLGWFFRELRASLVDLEEFFDVLRTPSSIPDGTRELPPPPPAPAPAAAAAVGAAGAAAATAATTPPPPAATDHQQPQQPQPQQQGEWGLSVELDDVHFGYHPGREVLKGVSLRVAPGESVAIVGPSGSGKSSVLRLVTRLYDAQSGTVKVGGVDVRDLRRSSLRGATAVVPQETVLLNDSLLQNVRYGRPGAPDADVLRAIEAARLGAAVARMPEGALTGVGERGLKLSGGEKQRVAIARAFLKAPRLLICDEASSALDSATEAAIMAELAELAVGRTCLYVAHRLSTVRGCDRIVVLKEGRVVEEGSHEQLLALGGLYSQMWARQSSEGVGRDDDGNDAADADRTRDEDEDGEEDGGGGGGGGSDQEDQEADGGAAEVPALLRAGRVGGGVGLE